MASFVIKLSAGTLPNPDLDLRYRIPDLLEERSNGVLQDDGYDYGPVDESNLYLFLKSDDLEAALSCIRTFMANETVLDNKLSEHVVVALDHGDDRFEVVFPEHFAGAFAIE